MVPLSRFAKGNLEPFVVLLFLRKWLYLRAVTFVSLVYYFVTLSALIELGERKGTIKGTKRFFVRARTDSHCLFLIAVQYNNVIGIPVCVRELFN